MNHRIAFYSAKEIIDELDQVTFEFEYFCSAWCAIKTIKGYEYFSAGRVSNQFENEYRFIIRYIPGITNLMQIKYKERTFKITEILNDDEANKTITIIAKE